MTALRTSDGIAVADQAVVTSRLRGAVRAIEEGDSDREAWASLVSDEQRFAIKAVVARDRKRWEAQR